MVRLKWEIKWDSAQLGKTNDFVMIDGIKYFNRDFLNMEYLKENDHHTEDDKGQINYYDIVVDGKVYENGAWYYTDYKSHARDFSNFVAFGEDVKLSV
ncbi:DUF427 domain-containing protein [Methanolobus halotolerans]|uniref:Nucleotidyltransferase domain-containing protein n=1 Tax=Methanolobus halotolerans TaxID=2052935 RepID=A0A4E0Q0G8_9EURY|nr:DUF427 domain-containing protein [Methanolobus halotolerans]TGC09812.1 nucleotidyltransferase domain-containing protein [Methanolobus halotolerans]